MAKLRPGDTSPVFLSHLGFHIVQLTAIIEPREMRFGEVRKEVANKLENQARGKPTIQLAENLSGAEFARATRRSRA